MLPRLGMAEKLSVHFYACVESYSIWKHRFPPRCLKCGPRPSCNVSSASDWIICCKFSLNFEI